MADVIQVASAIPLAYWLVAASLVVLLIVVMRSLWVIGPTQVGLVRKRYSRKRLDSGSPVALDGAAGYQAELLTAGLRFKLWPLYTVTRHPLVQIPAGQSMEGFVFMIDLQVQIHVPDSDAPRVISTVGTMSNLVNEVLQAAVGNHFRDKLQGMPAIDFIQKRADVQAQAQEHISERLRVYRVETRGVYIQDVVFPAQLVEVLTAREIANQQKARYDAERTAQDQRLLLEASRGKADQQSALAQSMVGVDIARNKASAVQAEADGEAYRLTKVGEASAVQTRAEGLAVAVGLEAQQQAVGAAQAAMINVAKALASGTQRFMPENLAITSGGGGDGIGIGPLVPQLMRWLQSHDTGQGRARDDGAGAARDTPREQRGPSEQSAGHQTGEPPVMQWGITPSVAAPPRATDRPP